jgi:hypothetical protein
LERKKTENFEIPLEKSDIYSLYVKIFPVLPLREIATSEFATHLIGPCLPWVSLVKLSVGGKSYPALISEGIPGSLLRENHSPSLDPYCFTRLGMPSTEVPGSVQLVSIDNDRSFFPAFDVDGSPLVKDITFCFDEMRLPIHPLAREIFLAINPYNFLANWLQILKLEETDLFSKAEKMQFLPRKRKEPIPQDSLLTLNFPSGHVELLYTKMMKLQKILTLNPYATFSLLLRYMPEYSLKIVVWSWSEYAR